MGKSASVFIMDVTQSHSFPDPDQLTRFLRRTTEWINDIAVEIAPKIAVKHRLGDEVIVLAEGYATAYVIAFYVKITWPYPNHMPYFGVSYGDIASHFPISQDLDQWNSPIVKWARNAAHELKARKPTSRPWLRFGWDTQNQDQTMELLNELANIQDRFFKLQTSTDRLVSCLFTIQGRQERIATTLKKNKSTVSRQVRKSNVDLLLTTKHRISHILNAVQRQKCQVTTTDREEGDDQTYRALLESYPEITGAQGSIRASGLDEIVSANFTKHLNLLLSELTAAD